MKQGWEKLPFEDSIVKVKYTTKIPSNDYLEQGLYPIVSQEEGLISGYWDNANDVFKVSSPVVIFGDHTRILKYVDFDFVLGADGVKILQPIKSIDAKYFKLYLESCKIPSLGYSRHYKLLKELQVPIPPREEQEKIVAELDCLSGIIEKKKQQLKEYDALAQSIFYEMFGNPIDNEKGWETNSLGEIANISSGGTPSRKKTEYFTGNINWYSAGELNNLYLPDSIEKITEEAINNSAAKVFKANSLMVGMYDTAAFKLGILRKDSASNQACANIDLHSDNVVWMYYLLSLMKEEALKHRHGIRQKNLNVGFIKSFVVPLPPLALQQEFASKIEAIEKQKELIKQSIAETETLFNSRMDFYFG